MIDIRSGTKIWLAAGVTDMRRGFDGLSAKVQTVLEQQPFSGHVFVFRGRRGDIVKLLWWDGDGLCLFAKRLERGRFIWPQATEGHCLSDACAKLDVAGRYRLASTAEDLDTRDCSLIDIDDSLLFMRVFAAVFHLFSWHTVCMDAAQLPDSDGLGIERALKALLIAHQEEVRTLAALAASHQDELRSTEVESRPISRHSPNKTFNCVQAASRSNV